MGWCFYWTAASRGLGGLQPLMWKSTEQGLRQISWEGGRASFCHQGCLCSFFFVSYLNYAFVSWNALGTIHFGLNGTRTELITTGSSILKSSQQTVYRIQWIFPVFRHGLYDGPLIPHLEQSVCCRCRTWLCACVCAQFHGPRTPLIPLRCFLTSPGSVELTSLKD